VGGQGHRIILDNRWLHGLRVNVKLVRKMLERLSIPTFRGHRHGRLLRHYFLISVLSIAGALIASGLLEIYFRYQDSMEQLAFRQREAANIAALKIQMFIHDIETAMKAATKYQNTGSQELTADYEFELKKLFYLAPAITEAAVVSVDGIARAHISRSRAVTAEAKRNFSGSAAFQTALQGQSYFGPVYFVRESEPYITVALPLERYAGRVVGVLQAEVNLKYVWEVISAIKQGTAGYAYAVTRAGDLIAHPDMSVVLQHRNVAQLNQVKAAFQPALGVTQAKAVVADNLSGDKVFSSYALIPTLDWAVIVEQPVGEAYEPLYGSMLRTSSLVLVGLVVALLASLFVARRVLGPLELLRKGTERIGGGDLDFRLNIKSGDEIEVLADEFNKMTEHLSEAYTGLERKVAERTKALTVVNEKLDEANKHKSQFLANVNHELRTPVSAIIGYARLVQRETEGQISALQRENLQDLLHNAERLLNQIDSLLDFAKIEAGKLEVRVEPLEVDEVIQGAISTIESTLNGGSVRIVREIAPGISALNTDREKLRQIILNLLGNAVKFTERGEIKISACQQNGSLKLVVSDTGIGIEKKDLDQIFEKFHQGDLSATKKYRGTGLGLAIVKRFVELLGGEVAVESEVGKGSVFTVTLPLDRGDSVSLG
jgi:signal transduction histidine kinase